MYSNYQDRIMEKGVNFHLFTVNSEEERSQSLVTGGEGAAGKRADFWKRTGPTGAGA